MKIYKSQNEAAADVNDGIFKCDESVTFEVSITLDASLDIRGSISAWNISAWDINARDISARNINAWNISARNISAWDISAWNINALDISARNIIYFAVCFAYKSFVCSSIKGKRKNAKHFCLDSEIKNLNYPDLKKEKIKC